MLLNVCKNYLETQIQCDTPSTDGYEINNLLTVSDKGFLAYSCIKPPINIDFLFICNIKLSHIIIWARVGAQKSSGFKISTKYRDNQYKLLSTEFLATQHMGCMFYNNSNINQDFTSLPINFSTKSIDNCPDYINNLRLTIFKTENSVPAISAIEIWGYISPKNSLISTNKINQLWLQHNESHCTRDAELNQQEPVELNVPKTELANWNISTTEIPEEFLDPITCDIMTQPVVLPSGKIVDQSTLENFGNSEALWGRPLSDPYTGIIFTNNYKPIFSSTLKLKIDKFLSDNSKNPKFKNLPRTLGHNKRKNLQPIDFTNINGTRASVKNLSSTKIRTKLNNFNKIDKTITRHKSLIASTISTNGYKKIGQCSTTNNLDDKIELEVSCNIDDNLKHHLKSVLSNLKCFGDGKDESQIHQNICKCCSLPGQYKLPCEHIVCRKFILSNAINSQCPQCNNPFKSHDIIKVHIW